MKFVALLWIQDADKNTELRPAHLSYLHELYGHDKVVAAGRFSDGSGGMVIYEVESMDEVERLVKEDPVVKGGARTYDIKEWNPLSFTHEIAQQ